MNPVVTTTYMTMDPIGTRRLLQAKATKREEKGAPFTESLVVGVPRAFLIGLLSNHLADLVVTRMTIKAISIIPFYFVFWIA